ncbi:MAG: flagellar hook-length control protein FliK [Pseudomonadota bacterium]
MTDIQSLLPVQKFNISKSNASQLRPAEPQRNHDADVTERRSDRPYESKSTERRERADESRAERADRHDRAERADRKKQASDSRADETGRTGGRADDDQLQTEQTIAQDHLPSFELLLEAQMPSTHDSELAAADLPIVDAPPIHTPLPAELAAQAKAMAGQQLISSTAVAALTATTQAMAVEPSALAGLAAKDMAQLSATALQAAASTQKAAPGVASVEASQLSGDLDPMMVDGDLTFTQRAPLDAAIGRATPAWAADMTANGNSSASTLASSLASTSTAPALGAVASVVTAAAQVQASIQSAAVAVADLMDAPVDGEPTSQSNGQAAADTTSARASNAAMAARDPVLAHRAMNQAGMEIARAVRAGKNHFEIKLDPPELGRIEVRMMMDKDKAQARLQVERPETLDMLMRDKTQLERILSASGFDLEGGIDMQLMDQSDEGSSGFENLMGDDAGAEANLNSNDNLNPAAIGNETASGEDGLMENLSADVVAAISEAARNPFALNRIA